MDNSTSLILLILVPGTSKCVSIPTTPCCQIWYVLSGTKIAFVLDAHCICFSCSLCVVLKTSVHHTTIHATTGHWLTVETKTP